MTHAATMLDQYPAEINLDKELIAAAIEAAVDCAQACTACADACLAEDRGHFERMHDSMTKCIRDNLDCADVCDTTWRVLSRHTGYDAHLTRVVLEACVRACRTCGDTCAGHAEHMAHCATCAESCRACERACDALLAAIVPADAA